MAKRKRDEDEGGSFGGIVGIIVAVVLAWGAYWWYSQETVTETTPPPAADETEHTEHPVPEQYKPSDPSPGHVTEPSDYPINPDAVVPISPPPPAEPSVGEGPPANQPQPVYPTDECVEPEEGCPIKVKPPVPDTGPFYPKNF